MVDTSGPAFPTATSAREHGLSKRDAFALSVLPAIFSAFVVRQGFERREQAYEIATLAYALADAMLEARAADRSAGTAEAEK